jgi:hypothetical protein
VVIRELVRTWLAECIVVKVKFGNIRNTMNEAAQGRLCALMQLRPYFLNDMAYDFCVYELLVFLSKICINSLI